MDYLIRQIAEISWDTLYNNASSADEATRKAIARQHLFGSADRISMAEYEHLMRDNPMLAKIHLETAANIVAMLKKEHFIHGVQ